MAQERGIGVTPAKIEVGQNVEWPFAVPITVTNLSSETENFEVTFEKDVGTIVSVSPGRFSLDSGASARVLVTFEQPRGKMEGLVKVVSSRISPEGFTTGTGVKIPFYIMAQGDSMEFLAGVGAVFRGFGGFDQLFGAGMILATLILLWCVSGITGTWISNSEKR
jgi:hypothetical protein